MPKNQDIDQLKQKIVQLEGDLQQSRVSELLLRRRETNLKAIINQFFPFMVIINTNGFILEMNQACLDVSGRFAENAVGSLLWEAGWWRPFPEVKRKTIFAIHKAVNGETVRDKVVFLDKNGRTHQGSRLFTPIRGNGGDIEMISVVGADISAKVEAENQLQESETRFRSVFDNSGVAMIIVDLKGNFSKVNAAAVTLFGYEEKELLLKNYRDITHSDDLKNSNDKYADLAAGKYKTFSIKKRYIQKSGRIVWGITTVSILDNKDDKQWIYIAQIQDITDRVIALQKWETSAKQYRQIAETIPGVVCQFILKSNGKKAIPYVSSHIKKYSGLSAEQVMINPELFIQQIHPDDRECFGQKIQESAQTLKELQIEHRILNNKGEERWLHVRSSPVKQECGSILWNGVGLDITDRKRTERNTLRYKNIVSSTSDFIALIDLHYVYQIVNDQYVTSSGMSREQIVGGTISELVGQDIFLKIIKPNLDRCFSGETVTYQTWTDFPAQGRRYYTFTHIPYRENGVVCGAIVNGKDLTEMESANDSVRKANKELKLRGKITQLFLTSQKDDIYQGILECLRDSFNSELGYFASVDEFGDLVCPALEQGIWDLCQINEKNILCKGDIWKIERGKAHPKQSAFLNNGPFNTPEGHPYLKNLLFTPIQAQGTLVGQIALANKDTEYTKNDLEDLVHLAEFISPILHIHRQKELYFRELNENLIKVEQQNNALTVLLDKRSEEKQRVFTEIVESIDKLIHPFIIEGKRSNNIHKIKSILSIIEQNLDECTGFVDKPFDKLYRKLTITEIKVVNLLRLGNSSKEIADMLRMSIRVVYFHRNNIRRKLGLQNEKINLQAYLLSI